MKVNIYPAVLLKQIDFFLSKHYIPHLIKQDDHCKLYRRYFNLFDQLSYKVENIFKDDNDNEYYEIRYIKYYGESNIMYGIKSYPLDSDTYELRYDSRGIGKFKERDIINSKNSLLGSEIKYWFFLNNIDLLSEKYNGFLSYLDYSSLSQIVDDKYYLLFAEYVEDKDIYRDCKVVLDKYKE